MPVVDGTATDVLTETWEPTGELVWDVAARRLVRLELTGRYAHETVTERDPDQPGSTYVSTFYVDGERTFRAAGDADVDAAIDALAAR